jgi:hypothetical protein
VRFQPASSKHVGASPCPAWAGPARGFRCAAVMTFDGLRQQRPHPVDAVRLCGVGGVASRFRSAGRRDQLSTGCCSAIPGPRAGVPGSRRSRSASTSAGTSRSLSGVRWHRPVRRTDAAASAESGLNRWSPRQEFPWRGLRMIRRDILLTRRVDPLVPRRSVTSESDRLPCRCETRIPPDDAPVPGCAFLAYSALPRHAEKFQDP